MDCVRCSKSSCIANAVVQESETGQSEWPDSLTARSGISNGPLGLNNNSKIQKALI